MGRFTEPPCSHDGGSDLLLLLVVTLLQGLAASGLRAMRYACEVDGVGEVVALDKDPGENHA